MCKMPRERACGIARPTAYIEQGAERAACGLVVREDKVEEVGVVGVPVGGVGLGLGGGVGTECGV